MTDSNIPDDTLVPEGSGSSKRQRKKQKGGEVDNWRPDGRRDPFAMLDALPEEKQQQIQRSLHLYSLGTALPKTLAEAGRRPYRFWDTQPVPKLGDEVTSMGPLVEDEGSVREQPYSLPQGFSWCQMDLSDPAEMKQLCVLLNDNYTEDDDNTLRLEFSPEYLLWALCPPGWQPQWHCGVRVDGSQRLVGFIAAVPANVRTYDTERRMVRVNFLCVHKKLRLKRMAPVLIREVTRRANQQGVYQALYTAGVVLPKPLGTCRYWHRALNLRKLIDVNFSTLGRSMTLQRSLKLNRLPETTKTAGLRPMRREDIPGVHVLLQAYLARFHLTYTLSLEEVEHWLLPRETVIDTYVVEGADGALTDLVSFYAVTSRVMNHLVHSELRAAHSFYTVSTNTAPSDLVQDTLVLAKAKGFDVFTTLDAMENTSFLEKLKFSIGDKNLFYYLYNWKCPTITPDKMGLVLP